MKVWFYTIASVSLVNIISLVGVFFLSLRGSRLQRILLFLVSFAVGGLFGDAFIHLLPETFRRMGINLTASLYIIVGILIFFVLEKFVRWRHCHIPTSQDHPHPVVFMNLIGDGVHNFIDGLVIGASYCINIQLGIATTLAVVFHEIPQEIGDFGVLVHGGLSVKKALTYNFLSAITALLGAIISMFIGPHVSQYATALLPITAGGFIYIAGSDLIPELHGCEPGISSFGQFAFMILGISIMALLILLG